MTYSKFGPLSDKPKSKRIVALDTEDDSRGNMIYGVLWHDEGFEEAESAEEMREILSSRRWAGRLCVCVNMEYDLGSVFGRDWSGLEATYTRGGMVVAKLILRDRRRRRHKGGRKKDAKSREYLEFIDLRNIDRSASVARLGKLIGMEKLEETGAAVRGRPKSELTFKEWCDLKKYCQRDAEITYLAGVKLQDEFNKLGGDFACTIGRVAMTVLFRTSYLR